MSHSITMSTPTVQTSKKSSISIYATFPVIVKFIQVMVGIACFGIAAHDMIINFPDLLARTGSVVTEHKLSGIVNLLTTLLRPVVNLDYAFIDQLTCRVVFLTVTTIFLTISLVQLTWFPASLYTGPIKSRIISGVIYHLISFVLHLLALMFLQARIDLLRTRFYNFYMMRIAVIIGSVNAALYLLSVILALWSFIGRKTRQTKSYF